MGHQLVQKNFKRDVKGYLGLSGGDFSQGLVIKVNELAMCNRFSTFCFYQHNF